MKKFLLILLFFSSNCIGQNLKLIELEVCNLYSNYCKKRNVKAVVRTELDTLAQSHLNYLSTLDSIQQVSHTSTIEGLETFNQRIINLYNYTNQSSFAEVLSSWYSGSGKYGTEKDIAEKLFNLLLSSPPHKKILDERTNKSFSFKVSNVKNGGYVLIGVFSGDDFFYLRKN